MLFTSRYYVFGGAAILSFLLYFLYFGSGNWLTLLLFLFGIMLLVVELFIPDFGLVGIVGFLMVAAGLFLNNERILESVLDVSLAIIISGIATSVLLKKGYKFLPDRSKLILDTSLNRERGYSSSQDYSAFLGMIGTATTTLRPAGKVTIDGVVLDVVSDGKIISEGKQIRVIQVEGVKITVKELDGE
jgi:membrane-bound serine protease (ClpP class)